MERLRSIMGGLQNLFGNTYDADIEAGVQAGNAYMAVFLHSLHIGGSQMAMLEMLRLLKSRGIQPVVCSVHDGASRDAFLREAIPCCICGQPENREEVRAFFLEHFDYVWLNTVSAYYFSYLFINTTMPVIWWFHETKEVLSAFDGFFPNPLGLSGNIRFVAITKRMQESISTLYEKESLLLPLSVKDERDNYHGVLRERIRFLLPGTYKVIKGYDLFLKAVTLLPAELRLKAEFVCCGYTYPEDQSYRDKLEEIAGQMDNVIMLDSLSRETLYQHYADCDCVVAPSRLDATPTTIIEGMMFEKLTITSNAAGISVFMKDCVNGFVFPTENAEELMKRMALVIADHASLRTVAAAGRKTYEEYFTPEAVRDRLDTVLESVKRRRVSTGDGSG